MSRAIKEEVFKARIMAGHSSVKLSSCTSMTGTSMDSVISPDRVLRYQQVKEKPLRRTTHAANSYIDMQSLITGQTDNSNLKRPVVKTNERQQTLAPRLPAHFQQINAALWTERFRRREARTSGRPSRKTVPLKTLCSLFLSPCTLLLAPDNLEPNLFTVFPEDDVFKSVTSRSCDIFHRHCPGQPLPLTSL